MTKLKKPDENKPVFLIFPQKLKAIKKGKCTMCDKPLKGEDTEFRNDISRREYSINGSCQACQDSLFGID